MHMSALPILSWEWLAGLPPPLQQMTSEGEYCAAQQPPANEIGCPWTSWTPLYNHIQICHNSASKRWQCMEYMKLHVYITLHYTYVKWSWAKSKQDLIQMGKQGKMATRTWHTSSAGVRIKGDLCCVCNISAQTVYYDQTEDGRHSQKIP